MRSDAQTRDRSETTPGLRNEVSRLQAQVAELEATIKAICGGEVDAFVVNAPGGSQVYTLHGPDEPYRILAEQMNEGAATLNAEGTILFCNRRLAEMAGRPAQLLLGSSLFALLDEDERRGRPDLLALACTKDIRLEARLQHAGGSRMAVQLSFSPIKLDGSDSIICVVVTDIGELKQARRTLKQQAGVFDLAHDAIMICDLDDRILSWNRGAQDLYGWSEQEAIGNKSHVLLQTALPASEENVRELIASSPGWEGEYRQVARDGRALIVANRSSMLRDEPGKPSAILQVNRDVTSRKKAESAALASAQQFRLIVETVADYALIMLDPGGHVVTWNVGAERLQGYNAEEIIGQHFSRFYLSQAIENAQPEAQLRFAAQRGRYTEEGWRVRKDGSTFLADTFIAPIFDDQGKMLGFAKVLHDITERKATERSLRQQALILDMATDTVFIRDGQNRITYWNQGAENLYGWKKGEVLGRVTHTLLKTRFPKPLAEIEAQLLAAGHWEGELVHTRRDGSRLTVASSWTLQRDESNTVLSVLEVNHDISGLKLNEQQAIQHSAELEIANRELNIVVRRLGLATDALQAGIWDWDVRTNAIRWDERMYEIYGIPDTSQMDYQTWASTVLAEDLPAAEAMLQKVIASRSQGSEQFRIKLPTGAIRFIQAAEGAILDDAGEVVRLVGINIDTTDRKFNEDLERQVGERTAQLKTANKELEEFAYVASHDLKAPLRVIDNATRWLEEDLEEHLTPETRENLDLLRSRVGRMDKLLDDLLEYARIGRAMDARYTETIQGDVLLGDVLALLDPRGLTLSVSPSFAGIRVCRMPLQQILMNLIGNAIKHHDKKAGHIMVEMEDEGDCYVFMVRDDGPGIPAQFHEQIFKMFQTLKPRDQVEGSGMGLALVRKNVELLGGAIRLESAPGEGSTFRFTWPKRPFKKHPELRTQ